MTPFEHTIAITLQMHRPLGEGEAVFMHTRALNALPRRTYIDGRLLRDDTKLTKHQAAEVRWLSGALSIKADE